MLLKSPKFITFIIFLFVIIVAAIWYLSASAAPQENVESERFIIGLNTKLSEAIADLKSGGFIKSPLAFKITLALTKAGDFKPGGYKISKSMNAWTIAQTLKTEPYMKWVIIPEGYRKEQIAEILARNLDWSEEITAKWIEKDTAQKADYVEGVYFPDTYLIPVDESPSDVAARLIAKFNEKFTPYLIEAAKQNIRWLTLLKIASIIERETGSKEDMPLISGIIWNRLLKNIKLDIDATVQYARGNAGGGFWAPLKPGDTKIDSPFNTYLHSGLPPHPISNPGLSAIDAALHPTKTDCLYYLHDSSKQIHCTKTYKEHKTNIEIYLKNNSI